MLIPVLLSLSIVFATILIHGFGTIWGVRYIVNHSKINSSLKLKSALYLLAIAAIFLMILHFTEITLWATVYLLIPEINQLSNFEEAIYFSMITYTTVGYGDITLEPNWRIMSGFEAMNGIVLFGWSTALLFTVVQKIIERSKD